MAVYKDKNGTWYVSARYTNWKGEADRKVKRGFQTKREAAEWEKNFFLENAGNLDMTFEAFYQLYKQNTKDRIKLNTWKMKESVIEGKILPYFRSRRMNEIKPRDVVTLCTRKQSLLTKRAAKCHACLSARSALCLVISEKVMANC